LGIFETRGYEATASFCDQLLELRTSSNECFAFFVSSVFNEVFDEAVSEVVSFNVPVFNVGVSVTGIEDVGVNTGEFGGHFEVEDGEFFGGSFEDIAVKDSVDDATSIFDRDTFASAVPTSVNEVSFSAANFHFLNELFSVFCGVKLEECLTEAS
jgi:hypothetical protein